LSQEVGSFFDTRDGKRYLFIRIYDQWWLKENMNIGAYIGSGQDATDNGIIEKYCYNNDSDYCAIYGGLYQWDEMMDYNPSDDADIGTTQGICPDGWHIPTETEWQTLIDTFGGYPKAGGALKEPGYDHWGSPNIGATNESGFTALPGSWMVYTGYFGELGWHGLFSSSVETDSENANVYYLDSIAEEIFHHPGNKKDAYSIRCIMDPGQPLYLTFLNTNLKLFSKLDFSTDHLTDTLIVINSSDGFTIEVDSIYTKYNELIIDPVSFDLPPGDSIKVSLDFNPSLFIYEDTLFVKSNNPDDTLVSLRIFNHYLLQASVTDSTNVSCAGLADGSATVTPGLGAPPYQYLWDDPGNSTSSTVTGLEADRYYHVTVTDSEENMVTDSIMLSQPDSLELQFDFSDSICLHSTTGYIDLTPSGGTSPYEYLWSNEQTTEDIEGLAAGSYSVTITDEHGCQFSDTVYIPAIEPFPDGEICLVTVDPEQERNMIIWEKTPGQAIQTYLVYRETTISNEYDTISEVEFADPGSYIDMLSDPKQKSYKYRISVIDTCGNESSLSEPHSTMHLTLNQGLDGGINLIWSQYEGFEVQSYKIWRGQDLVSMAHIGSVTGSNFTYTDEFPLSGTNNYQVEVVSPNICDPDRLKSTYSSSFSNIADVVLEGIPDKGSSGIRIFPNPVGDILTVSLPNQNQGTNTVTLFDACGRVLMVVNESPADQIQFDCSEIRQGIYFIEIRGTTYYRGKVIIE
jgi:uncharacterized protein (TIGR02145 family)